MIRAEELMIGDWVLDGTQDAQVTGITCDGIIETTANDNSNIELLKPIPITSEILEKNGFWYETNVGYVLEDYEYEIIYDSWEHELRVLKNREQILKIDFFDKMSVHELQHALKLCGISKNIEL